MPKSTKVKLQRETKKPKKSGRALALAIATWGFLGLLAAGALGAAAMAGVFWVYGSDPKLPKIGALADYKPKQVTRIYSADGRLIGEIFEERRTFVPLERIAPIMQQAIIDTEDARFRQHAGLDFFGMVRALVRNVKAGQTKEGASTITQQVVKTFLLSPERTLRRKVQEIILARRLEQRLSKDEILTLYLNQIYFGHGRYGVEEAARYYFAKSAAELNTGEAALLAGIVNAPGAYSPHGNPKAAKERQTKVLERLRFHGHIDAAEEKKWVDAGITVVKNTDPGLGSVPEVVDLVRAELGKKMSNDEMMRAGLTVRTSIDLDIQAAAREALENGLDAVDNRHGYKKPLARLSGDKLARKQKQLKNELAGAPRGTRSYEAIVVSVSDANDELVVDLGGWRGAVILSDPSTSRRYNPDKKKPSERYAAGDLVSVKLSPDLAAKSPEVKGALVLDQGPQGAIVVIDPASRHVLALVGGYGFQAGGYNRALRAHRQAGSSFKPFLYAAAIDSGKFTAASVVNDAPEVYDLWKPKNYEDNNFKGPVRLRTALALSINTVAIRLMSEVGAPAVIALARAMGDTSGEMAAELSLALGSGDVVPIEHVNAFASFAAGGVYAPPVVITKIGNEQPAPAPSSQALRPEVAYITTSLMTSVVEEGTATPARKLKRALAGKTGTSNGGRDLWFVGFSPDLVAGVWIGFDDRRSVGRGETGGKAAVPIWIDVMKAGLKGRGQKAFKQPAGVVTARVDRKTGKLAAPGESDAAALEEVFLEGSVPREVAPASNEVNPDTFVLDQMDSDDPEPKDMKAPKGDAADDEAAIGASDPVDQ